jgi:hypothetical protein
MVELAEGGLLSWYPSQRSQVRAPTTHIPLRVIIPTYRRPYGGARVAQTSETPEQSDGTLAGT